MNTTPFGTPFHYRSGRSALVAATILIGAAIAFPCRAQNNYNQHNLVSDISGLADHTDPQLVNPWGIASTGASPFWVSDNGTGVSTLYNSSGTKQGLVVTIPPPATPTGVVFNSNSASSFNGDLFIFATEGGTIDGWRGALGTSAETLAIGDNGLDAVFKGIAIATQATGTYIYAANFLQGHIAVLPGTAATPPLPGTFTDPTLPSGYAPFNIQNINGSLLVTYAVQDASKHDEVDGAGFGIVDRFDLNGNFLQRLISNGALSALNAPWGLAIAPANFGMFSNDLLVGNFGDGRINAFDPLTGAFLGTLDDNFGNPIEIPGLWGLRVGNGGNGGDLNSVYFAAGIPGPDTVEDHGLFGSLTVPDSGATFTMMAFALAATACCARLLQTAPPRRVIG
jgi:uncharacterized protein (TIGR03118 family)